ncbi:uncharacterized protein TNCV_1834441 [Trichonephila clavipes]|nr:uncharacterized protein TNCV_1834441 [Trichonephila clavipes]
MPSPNIKSDVNDAGVAVSSETIRRLADARQRVMHITDVMGRFHIIGGTLNGEKYTDTVLEPKLLPSIRYLFTNNALFIFQQDSAPCHTVDIYLRAKSFLYADQQEMPIGCGENLTLEKWDLMLLSRELNVLTMDFTCRNCGGGDRGRVAIYRPFGEVSLSLNRTVTCMVLKANDRRTSCPCHDEFRGPRSDYVRQVA